MAEYTRNHYIPNKVLKNFANIDNNGKYIINVIDLHEETLRGLETSRCFYENNLYDVKNDDVKKLEKDLNEKIEQPFYKILDRLVNEIKDTFTITRAELEIIKKYILIQQYRNLKNSFGYSENWDSSIVLSRYNIKDDESPLDFWKREMQTILDNSLDDLIRKMNLVGVKQKTMNIYTGFLMFVHTCDEFVINDLGCVTERTPVKVKFSPEEYAEINEKLGKELYGAEGFGQTAKMRAETNSEYMDNYFVFPVSSDLAILVVDEFWKVAYINSISGEELEKCGILPSPFLSKYFSLPKNDFVNKKLIKKPKDLVKYKSSQDKYTYQIHELDILDTIYINNLLMNETHRYLGFRTKEAIMPSIAAYTMKAKCGMENVKNNFDFVVCEKNFE